MGSSRCTCAEICECTASLFGVHAMIKRFLGALILVSLLALPASAAELRLTVKGVRSDRGEILIALYDNAEGFANAIAKAATRGLVPDSGRLIGTSMRAKAGTQSTVFTQLPPGRYAVIVFHDENDNGRLDKDGFGVPTEGYGFGNDAQGLLSSPVFDAAAIAIRDVGVSTSISLIYPREPSVKDKSEYDQFIGKPNEPSR
jgi:uncharacterized protein (DUF2141 family)